MPYDDTFYSRSLTSICLKIQAFCDNDKDIWAALTSGCFRYSDASSRTPPIEEWWLPESAPVPTFHSVVRDWEMSALRTAGRVKLSTGVTAEEVRLPLEATIRGLDEDIDAATLAIQFTKETGVRLSSLSDRWGTFTRQH